MADPFPTEVVLNMSFKLERAHPEEELTCWFCRGNKCEWDTVYKIGGTRTGVGIHEYCRAVIAERYPVKPVSELEEAVTDLEMRLIERNARLFEAKRVITMALNEWYESDWTNLAYDFLGKPRHKSVSELEIEVKALELRIQALQSGQVETTGSDQSKP